MRLVLQYFHFDPGLVVEFHYSFVSSLFLLSFSLLAVRAGRWIDQAEHLNLRTAEAVLAAIEPHLEFGSHLWRRVVAAHREL